MNPQSALRTPRRLATVAAARLLGALLFVNLLAAPARALADVPLAAPAKVTMCSENKRFCVDMDPDTERTTAYEVTGGTKKPLWSMREWSRVGVLSNDGRTLVTFDSQGYISQDAAPLRAVIASVFRDGVRVRNIRAGDVLKTQDELQKTVSHYLWGNVKGFDAAGRLVLETRAGRRVYFDAVTGSTIP